MKTLNLIDLDKSGIKYKISKFPDGQQNITINSTVEVGDYESVWFENIKKHSIQIKSRLNNFLDLELIICAVASLRELGVEEIHLYTPYIMGARSDRKFEEGGNNYLKDVICPIINSLEFNSVTCIDPHSDCLEMGIKRFKKESNEQLIEFAIRGNIKPNDPSKDIILISPDAGASKKIYKLAEQIGYKGDIITCSKERDIEGKLTKTVVPWKEGQLFDKDVIIVDDICDGGRTFINIAEVIKNKTKGWKYETKIYLIVTHGIFSKGLEELGEYFNGIYCTNSYQDYEPDNDGQDYIYPHLVKQLNVF